MSHSPLFAAKPSFISFVIQPLGQQRWAEVHIFLGAPLGDAYPFCRAGLDKCRECFLQLVAANGLLCECDRGATTLSCDCSPGTYDEDSLDELFCEGPSPDPEASFETSTAHAIFPFLYIR